MTNTELVLNALAEVSTTEISKATDPKGMSGAKDATIQGGNIAKMHVNLWKSRLVEVFYLH